MSSHNQEVNLDDLFRQALEPDSRAKPTRRVRQRLLEELRSPSPPPRGVRRWLSWLFSFRGFYLAPQSRFYYPDPYTSYYSTPFVNLMPHQLFSLRLAA